MRKGRRSYSRHSRWCFLKNPENLTDNQKVKLKDLVKCNLKTIRAYLLKEALPEFLGLHLAGLGRQVLGSMVHPGDALKA